MIRSFAYPLDRCQKGDPLRIVDLVAQPRFGTQDEQVTLRLKELGFLPGNLLTIIGNDVQEIEFTVLVSIEAVLKEPISSRKISDTSVMVLVIG
mgnify:CR=1 FL=1